MDSPFMLEVVAPRVFAAIEGIVEEFLSNDQAFKLSRKKKRSKVSVAISVPLAAPEFALVGTHHYGPELDAEEVFDEIAANKAAVSWRTKMSTRQVVSCHSELLFERDYRYPGGIVMNGVAFSASGLEPEDDEIVAGLVGSTTHGFLHRLNRAMADAEVEFIKDNAEDVAREILCKPHG